MSKTPTIHNPTHFEPSDYEVMDYLDNKRPVFYGDAEAYEREVKWYEAEMLSTFGEDWRAKIHHCVHCGNGRVRWITATKHIPTGDVVVFGSDCTERLGFTNHVAFKLALIQNKAAAAKARFAFWNKREQFVAATPGLAAAIEQSKTTSARNFFVQDVLAKLNQFGALSEKQVAAVVAAVARDAERAAAAVVAPVEVKGDAPVGRVEVTGVVLSTKVQSGNYGDTLKMLVKLANNSRVWVSVPGKASADRGNTITFVATFEASKDDKSFAFGSRPTFISEVQA